MTLANHRGHRKSNEPIKSVDDAKRGKPNANQSRLVLVLILIG